MEFFSLRLNMGATQTVVCGRASIHKLFVSYYSSMS